MQLAQKVRSELKLSENEPINDIAEIINRSGVKIHFSNIPIDNFFGFSVGFEDGGPAISVNIANNISIERKTFTAAHELGHLLMHKDSFKSNLMEENEKEEIEANIFASYFLMPDQAFKYINNGTIGNHLFQLVREALEKDLLSNSKAAEILNKSNEEMIELSILLEKINRGH